MSKIEYCPTYIHIRVRLQNSLFLKKAFSITTYRIKKPNFGLYKVINIKTSDPTRRDFYSFLRLHQSPTLFLVSVGYALILVSVLSDSDCRCIPDSCVFELCYSWISRRASLWKCRYWRGEWCDMEAIVFRGFSSSTLPLSDKIETKWCGSYQYPNPIRRMRRFHKPVVLQVSCSSENSPVLKLGSSTALFDELKSIKAKSDEVKPYLNGRCIYLVGMMGSGKTTVGKVLSEALGYAFCDCDTQIEETVGVNTVAEIFKLYGESFFRDSETGVLMKLSSLHRLVVSTGGGAVVRPVNWRHMGTGISIWLDVPLEALARRITAVGTGSRPLLHQESGGVYAKTMKRLSGLLEERGEYYANANVRVSLEHMRAKLGLEDVCDLTPTMIGLEVLQQIHKFLNCSS